MTSFFNPSNVNPSRKQSKPFSSNYPDMNYSPPPASRPQVNFPKESQEESQDVCKKCKQDKMPMAQQIRDFYKRKEANSPTSDSDKQLLNNVLLYFKQIKQCEKCYDPSELENYFSFIVALINKFDHKQALMSLLNSELQYLRSKTPNSYLTYIFINAYIRVDMNIHKTTYNDPNVLRLIGDVKDEASSVLNELKDEELVKNDYGLREQALYERIFQNISKKLL